MAVGILTAWVALSFSTDAEWSQWCEADGCDWMVAEYYPVVIGGLTLAFAVAYVYAACRVDAHRTIILAQAHSLWRSHTASMAIFANLVNLAWWCGVVFVNSRGGGILTLIRGWIMVSVVLFVVTAAIFRHCFHLRRVVARAADSRENGSVVDRASRPPGRRSRLVRVLSHLDSDVPDGVGCVGDGQPRQRRQCILLRSLF